MTLSSTRSTIMKVIAVLSAVVVAALLWASGSLLVRDPSGRVAAAALVDGGGAAQPLRRVPGGAFVGIPRLEGAVRLRCVDGSVRRIGYATPRAHVSIVVPDGACARSRPAP